MDSEQLQALQALKKSGHIVLKRIVGSGIENSSFDSVMTRQIKFVQSTMQDARSRGIDFLLHIDDDEILFPVRSDTNIVDLFQRHMGTRKRCIHFENYEANFQFEDRTLRPFTRPSTQFDTKAHVLYCNGKSAASLFVFPNFASGVHHFCQFDRSFVESDLAFGEHDNPVGCTHKDCCIIEDGAVILHFDSPSFCEWQSKFAARAASKFRASDDCEMDSFPFKKESIQILRKRPAASLESQQNVYRRWRCLPGRTQCVWSKITGSDVQQRFSDLLESFRS